MNDPTIAYLRRSSHRVRIVSTNSAARFHAHEPRGAGLFTCKAHTKRNLQDAEMLHCVVVAMPLIASYIRCPTSHARKKMREILHVFLRRHRIERINIMHGINLEPSTRRYFKIAKMENRLCCVAV